MEPATKPAIPRLLQPNPALFHLSTSKTRLLLCIQNSFVFKRLSYTNFVGYINNKNKIYPMECPHCQSQLTVKHGKRKIKRTIVQVYKCQTCNKFFSDRKLKHKGYEAKTILRAVSIYNLGYTLEQTAKQMSKRFRQKIPLSTIQSWVKGYSDVCRFIRLREQAVKMYKPEEMIFTVSLQHNQIYKYQLHKAKLLLQRKELPQQKFDLLKAYLEKISAKEFPHHIFTIPDEELEKRASQLNASLLKVTKFEKQNLANKLTELGLMLAKTNKERHQAVQNFMLINDSVTIATEVPVYLTSDDISYFRAKGFTFNFESYRTPITGHIDLLQIRNGLICILDYKPEASKVNAVNQLTIYALALASRTKLAVKDFKCAWFDEKSYFEFFPLHAVYKK
jgi:transposase-like protein